MSEHKVIYLQPECCAEPSVGRLWCKDSEPMPCDAGVPWTKYVLASTTPQSDAAKSRQDLFDLLFNEHGISALETEMSDIEHCVMAIHGIPRNSDGSYGA